MWKQALVPVGGFLIARAIIGTMGISGGASAQDAGATPAQTGLGAATVGITECNDTLQTITIPVGGSVTWGNNDSVPHTATGDDPAVPQSGTIEPGADFTETFDTPGTYTCYCEFHPDMTGTIIVQ